MKEIFKWIDGYEGRYQISNLGKVISFVIYPDGKQMSPKKDKDGYLEVGLRDGEPDSTKKFFRIHRLVAQAFIPNPNNYNFINHKDCNVSNNVVDNLEWCTIEYNNKYRFINGNGDFSCENHPSTKLTNKIVKEIYLDSLYTIMTESELADKYHTTRSVINKIRLKYTWKKVTDKIDIEIKKRKKG